MSSVAAWRASAIPALEMTARGGAPADAPSSEIELDLARLDVLGSLLPLEKVRELLTMYLLHTNERIAQVRALSAGEDLEALGREAHTLIGTSGNIGALRIFGLASALEVACRAAERATARNLAVELVEAAASSRAAITAWLEARQPGAPASAMAEAQT
jgi:HPt (histidine-containing phosphotransfer) domain-containing protein